MQEIHREDGFEATFVVSTPRDEAWKRLTKDADGRWWIPGVESTAERPGSETKLRYLRGTHVLTGVGAL